MRYSTLDILGPESLSKIISLIEESLGKKANVEYLDMQPGEVEKTCADMQKLLKEENFN